MLHLFIVRTHFVQCSLKNPLFGLIKLNRLLSDDANADFLPSITQATAYNRTIFLEFCRAILSDGFLAAMLTSACDGFDKERPPRREDAWNNLQEVGRVLRTYIIGTYSVDNEQFVANAKRELHEHFSTYSGNDSNAAIASRVHAFLRNKYSYTQVRRPAPAPRRAEYSSQLIEQSKSKVTTQLLINSRCSIQFCAINE